MRFRRLDLNLLVALEALLDERSVTRAAERVNLSQAAMSNALSRLREHFNDDLLVRVGRRMVMTDRARVIRNEVSEVLRRIETRVLVAPEFNPSEQVREVVIMAADAVSVSVLSRVSAHLAKVAPGITLKVRSIGENPQHMMERGEMDFLVIPRPYAAPGHPFAELYSEPFSIVVAANSRHAAAMDRDTYLAADHVIVELGLERKAPIDRVMIEQTFGRLKQAVTVTSHANVPWYVADTDRIGTMPHRLARQFATVLPLVLHELPFDVPPNSLVLQWNRYAEDDACLGWLRDTMQVLCKAG